MDSLKGWIGIPAFFNEDKLPNPEAVQARIRQRFAELRAQKYARELPPARSLADFRKSCRVTQEELARRLGIKQTRISKLEHHPDLRLTTLQQYVEALGGSLHLMVRLPGRDLRLVP